MNTSTLPVASSITHTHLFACINTLLQSESISSGHSATIRILDAGCGNGKLIAYLQKSLDALYPATIFEIYGYDVADHGVQLDNFMLKTIEHLTSECPGIDWSKRVLSINAVEAWPFSSDFFDLVISNQGLEHVLEPSRFFSEHYRVLIPGGYGVHLFPLEHYIYEGHLLLPWVHRIKSWDLLYTYISFMSLLGFGKYPSHRNSIGISREDFSIKHADYIFFWTHYLKEKTVLTILKNSGFRASLRFSSGFYFQKLRTLLRLKNQMSYSINKNYVIDAFVSKFLRYISSITLTCHKQNRY